MSWPMTAASIQDEFTVCNTKWLIFPSEIIALSCETKAVGTTSNLLHLFCFLTKIPDRAGGRLNIVDHPHSFTRAFQFHTSIPCIGLLSHQHFNPPLCSRSNPPNQTYLRTPWLCWLEWNVRISGVLPSVWMSSLIRSVNLNRTHYQNYNSNYAHICFSFCQVHQPDIFRIFYSRMYSCSAYWYMAFKYRLHLKS